MGVKHVSLIQSTKLWQGLTSTPLSRLVNCIKYFVLSYCFRSVVASTMTKSEIKQSSSKRGKKLLWTTVALGTGYFCYAYHAHYSRDALHYLERSIHPTFFSNFMKTIHLFPQSMTSRVHALHFLLPYLLV